MEREGHIRWLAPAKTIKSTLERKAGAANFLFAAVFAHCCSGEQLDCAGFGKAQLAFQRKGSPGASGRSQPARP